MFSVSPHYKRFLRITQCLHNQMGRCLTLEWIKCRVSFAKNIVEAGYSHLEPAILVIHFAQLLCRQLFPSVELVWVRRYGVILLKRRNFSPCLRSCRVNTG
jgi:hypothetical protein